MSSTRSCCLDEASLEEAVGSAPLRGRATLREALGAEVLVHPTVEADDAGAAAAHDVLDLRQCRHRRVGGGGHGQRAVGA
jgi:hypothetical protein